MVSETRDPRPLTGAPAALSQVAGAPAAGRFPLGRDFVLRFLTGDDAKQSPAAVALFRAASEGSATLVIPTTAIQEAVYALETYYDETPSSIAPKLLSLLALPNTSTPDAAWLLPGIQWYREKNSDFGDALLCSFAAHHACEVATFDKGIARKFGGDLSVFSP